MAAERVTARHDGADRPHTHLVDAAALATAKRAAVQHIKECVVCALAYVAVQQRGSELEALGDIDSTATASRDQLYAETSILYCAVGKGLVTALGVAALGVAKFE